MWTVWLFNVTYSEAVHILLDCLRYSNQAESNRFAGDEARRELWFWNMNSTADSHKAPDTTDSTGKTPTTNISMVKTSGPLPMSYCWSRWTNDNISSF